MIRTRVAPSPTGHPHIGTIYQALFNWAYAKKHKGQFIVRIEDTDRERFIKSSEERLYNALDWFSISEDESPRKNGEYGPYRQSERLDIYKRYAEGLVKKNNAYYCTCSKERLDGVRKKMQKQGKSPMYDGKCRGKGKSKPKKGEFVIRMKVPKNKKIIFKDEIRGNIIFDSNTIDDQVIVKSDGYPTYHLAVVIDDHEMKITHVVRGEEWLSSSPKHTLLYDYFGWNKPLFFHTPSLRNPDKSKLSKRHGHTDIFWYKNEGFLPSAILNFIALMGWSHPKEKEIFSTDEFIKVFDLKDLKAVGPIFDKKKLEWMNGEYIRKMDTKSLKAIIHKFYNNKYPEDLIEKTIPLIKERIKTLREYDEYCRFFIEKPKTREVNLSTYKELLSKVGENVSSIDDWKTDKIRDNLQDLATKEKVPFSKFFMILRVAISGKKITPPLSESMEILGKRECLRRLK